AFARKHSDGSRKIAARKSNKPHAALGMAKQRFAAASVRVATYRREKQGWPFHPCPVVTLVLVSGRVRRGGRRLRAPAGRPTGFFARLLVVLVLMGRLFRRGGACLGSRARFR